LKSKLVLVFNNKFTIQTMTIKERKPSKLVGDTVGEYILQKITIIVFIY